MQLMNKPWLSPPDEGDFFYEQQINPPKDGKKMKEVIMQAMIDMVVKQNPHKKRKVLVYFIGGITFAEISALRFLN